MIQIDILLAALYPYLKTWIMLCLAVMPSNRPMYMHFYCTIIWCRRAPRIAQSYNTQIMRDSMHEVRIYESHAKASFSGLFLHTDVPV